MTITLRPYQNQCLESVRQAYRDGCRAPLLVVPTGGGKTVMFSAIARGVMQRKKRVLILAHRMELLDQIEKTLIRFDVIPSVVTAGRYGYAYAPVQVASVQTLIRRLKKFPAPDLIIVDEAHHAVGDNSWAKVLKHWHKALVLGVTATPCRLSKNHLLGETFDRMVIGPTVQELIDLGALSPVSVYAPPGVDVTNCRVRLGDYALKDIDDVMSDKKIVGDTVEHYRRYADGKLALAFCVSVGHAAKVSEEFTHAGYRSAILEGTMSKEQRVQIVQAFTRGEIQVLATCDLVSEGFDVPRVEVGILLRPTQSLGLYLQQCGRVLRPFEGKERAIILDHAGNVLRHGLPTEDREWEFAVDDGEGNRRKPETLAPLRVCGKCFAAYSPTRKECPDCGSEHTVKPRLPGSIAGQLEEITAAVKRKKQPNSANTLEGLVALGRMRGYANPEGWARHIMAARAKKKSDVSQRYFYE